jgi:hypothetical protein
MLSPNSFFSQFAGKKAHFNGHDETLLTRLPTLHSQLQSLR